LTTPAIFVVITHKQKQNFGCMPAPSKVLFAANSTAINARVTS